MNLRHLIVSVALAMSLPGPATAMSCHAQSGPTVLPLVELYTSEGCSSCPPADAWLSRTFASTPTGAATATVLAFHVDYWDRLGWRDRFASDAFTARQYEEVRRTGGRVVYTPQVLVQGRDYGLWRDAGPRAAWTSAGVRDAQARIAIDARNAGENAVEATIDATLLRKATDAQVMVALVQDGFVSDVRAGENAGTRLAHDHVVRSLAAGPSFDALGRAHGSVRLALPAERGTGSKVVAFVQDRRTGDVLQSVQAACTPE